MVRYTGNDDPTVAEGFNGLRTKDKIIRKQNPHGHTIQTSKQYQKRRESGFFYLHLSSS